MRSRSGPITPARPEGVVIGIGGVLWYLALIGSVFGWELEQMVEVFFRCPLPEEATFFSMLLMGLLHKR
jgi:hypothetical protein